MALTQKSNQETMTESALLRAEMMKELPEVVTVLGLMKVFEACFDRCTRSTLPGVPAKTKEEAALFAHKTFLSTMEMWLKK